MPAASRTARTSLTPRRRRRNDAPAWQLRAVFAGQLGRLQTRAEIHEQIWKRPFSPREPAVDVHARRIPIRLAEANNRWEYIHTHRGGGYRFEPEPAGGTSLSRCRRR